MYFSKHILIIATEKTEKGERDGLSDSTIVGADSIFLFFKFQIETSFHARL